MSETKLTDDLQEAGWAASVNGRAIVKTFKFRTFRDAIGWMVRAAFEADALDHHPEWANVYNRVEVTLTTHDAGGLTEKDIALAERLEAIREPG
ncbi:MAG: 4a-hydroxytetrahydrobiopterin dehydratase [Paracoccaceae bacterium]